MHIDICQLISTSIQMNCNNIVFDDPESVLGDGYSSY